MTYFEFVMNGFARPLKCSPEQVEKDFFTTAKEVLGDRMMTQLDCLLYSSQAELEMEITLRTDLIGNNVNTVCADSQALYNFWSAGKKVFHISRNLSRSLSAVELKTAWMYLHLPFPAFAIQFDEPQLAIPYEEDGSSHMVDTIFVFQQTLKRDPMLSLEFKGRSMSEIREEARIIEKESTREWPVIKMVAMSRPEGSTPGNMAFGHFSSDLPESLIIDHPYVHTEISKRREILPQKDGSSLNRHCVIPAPMIYADIWAEIFKILSYINSVNADVRLQDPPQFVRQKEIARQQGKKVVPKKIFSKARELSTLPYYAVGNSIHIPSGIPQTITSVQGGGWKYSYRFQVIGHHRHYWMKKENVPERLKGLPMEEKDGKVRVQMFVEAFWKGPDTAKILNREYDVDLPKD